MVNEVQAERFLKLFERYILCLEGQLVVSKRQTEIAAAQVEVAKRQSKISGKLQAIAAKFSEDVERGAAPCSDCEKPVGNAPSTHHDGWCPKRI